MQRVQGHRVERREHRQCTMRAQCESTESGHRGESTELRVQREREFRVESAKQMTKC